jgi:cysteinyl-tRNA synthetase
LKEWFINLLHDGKETLNAVDLDIFSNAMNAFIFDVLGLEAEKTANNSNDKLEAVVNMLIGMRNQARADKTLSFLTK